MPEPDAVGSLLRKLRTRPRPGKPKGLTVAEASRRTGLWDTKPLTESFWAQVERGHTQPGPSALLRLSLAVDATPGEITTLFQAAGYGRLHDRLVRLASAFRFLPIQTAEAGILSDPRLPYDKRRALLDHLEDILEAVEGGRVADEPEDRGNGDAGG